MSVFTFGNNKELNMAKWLGPTLKELATTERLSDCRFIIEAADGIKTSFQCHKFVFSCASNVFERMFYGDFKESKSNEIVLKNVRSEIFAKFREYIYTYDLKLLEEYDETTLIELVRFGQQYLVSSVTEECIKILSQRTGIADILILIQLFQFGNDILREDLIKDVWMNITSRFPKSINHFAVYELSSDVFFKYMEMCENKSKDAVRFNMIETYLRLNGFDMTKVISKPSDAFDENDLKTTDANETTDKVFEEHDGGDENKLENKNELEAKNNDPNEDKKEAIQNVKNSYIKNLLNLIDYKKMTPHEFYNGPGKSQYFDLQDKYDMLYATMLAK